VLEAEDVFEAIEAAVNYIGSEGGEEERLDAERVDGERVDGERVRGRMARGWMVRG
jgi:hypothetical protein